MSTVALTSVGAIEPLRNHRHGINAVAVDPSGRYVATSDVDMLVEVWEDDRPARWFDLRSADAKAKNLQRVRALTFAADGSGRLFAAAGERVLCLDPATGDILWQYTAPRTWAFLVTTPHDLAVVPDGRVAASFDSGLMVVFSADGRVIDRWRDDEAPRTLRFLDWFHLIGTDTFRLMTWELGTRRKVLRMPLPGRGFAMQLAPEHPVVALRSLEDVRLLDIAAGTDLARISTRAGLPRIAFHPHDRILAVSEKHAVTLFDFEGRELARRDCTDASVLAIAFAADGNSVLVGCSDRTLRRLG